MPKEKLLRQQVSFTEEKLLQAEELQQLKDKVFRQVIIYLPIYILFLGIALILFYDAPMAFKMVVDPSDLDDEELARMWKLGPYVGVFVFLMATIFFGKIFYQTVLPLLKDIKHKTKTLVFYKPQKTAMAFFNRYYISTPLFTKRRIEIDRNDFDVISDTENICLEVSKSSLSILQLKVNNKQINYHTSTHS
jgi:hypothetical protein